MIENPFISGNPKTFFEDERLSEIHFSKLELNLRSDRRAALTSNPTSNILIIDDFQENLDSIEELLTTLIPDSRIYKANTGNKGIKIARQKLPDVILLDIQLPDIDGYTVCKNLKTNVQTANIPIIFLTGQKTQTVDKVRGLQLGGDAYLTKPIDAGELTAQVNAMLRIKRAEDLLRKEKEHLKDTVQSRTQELRESWERYHRIFENIKDVYYEIFLDGTILELSPSIREISQFEKENLIGLSFFDLFKDSDQKKRLTEEIQSGRQLCDFEIELSDQNGRPIICSINSRLVQDEHGNLKNIGSIRDVTQRKIAEKKLEDYRSHLEELIRVRTKEVKEKQAQLAHSGRLASLGEMATGIAHELNQPLSIIRVQAEVLSSPLLVNKLDLTSVKEGLKLIISEVDRAALIINHMRGYARKQGTEQEEVDILQPLNRSLVFFNEQFKNNQITFTVKTPEALPPVRFAPQQFEQVIVNFLSNAQYAVNKQARKSKTADYTKTISITLSVDNAGEMVVCEVSDNGIGMTTEEIDRCLEPFYTTKKVGQGTGLGLSIVHSIINDFDSELSISSKIGQGTTMCVRIPIFKRK
ncbi:MAG: response regulator [FCB group bacterium]|nr:response regulator [FCB group bacterium]